MKKVVKSRGGRGGKKTKKKTVAVSSSAASIPADNQEDRLKQMLEALPVVAGPKPPPEPEAQPTFEGVKQRLLKANEIFQSLELSYAEVRLVLNKFVAIDQLAKELPASVENSSKGMPPEVWEFISGRPVKGSFEADAERNKKWVNFFGKRASQFFQKITDNILLGPSGAESEAAETTRDMIFLLLHKLERATRGSSPLRQRGRDAAKAACDEVLKHCHRKVEAAKKRQRRTAAYEKRGRKKPHTRDFAFQCEYWAQEFIFSHEDWLADPEFGFPKLGTFPRPCPTKRFGEDPAARADWEDWFYQALKHNIVRGTSEVMKKAWRSHSSDLKNRLIPSFWDKAPAWRCYRQSFEQEE